MIVDAFQTLEYKNNKQEIESYGPFKCTRPNAWLGHGYYFWDTDINLAHSWGENSFVRNSKKYTIAKTDIDLDNKCFDLHGSVRHQLDFIESIKTLINAGKIKDKSEIIVPNVISFMRKVGVFNYFSMRASDFPLGVYTIKYNNDRPEFTQIGSRVQICVYSKKNVILRPFTVVYP